MKKTTAKIEHAKDKDMRSEYDFRGECAASTTTH